MYVPAHFAADDAARTTAFLRRYSFATVVTAPGGVPFASHLPVLYLPERGERGAVLGHMARANPQWQDFASGGEALVVFQGPHGYVSPSWYHEHPSVPTWNYSAVHVYGRPRVLESAEEVRRLMHKLVALYERRFERPWRLDLDEPWTAGRLDEIVGFEIPVARLEAKLKLSQNRSAQDRAAVIAALRAGGDPEDAALADLMASVG